MLPSHGSDEALPAQVAQQLTRSLTRNLTHTQTHHPPTELRVLQQIRMTDALHRFGHAPMAMREYRILPIGMKCANRIAQVAPFAFAHRRYPLPHFDGHTFILGERFSQTIRSIHPHGHLTVFETRTALSRQQIYVITDTVQMRPFGPYRLHTVSTPDNRLPSASRSPIFE